MSYEAISNKTISDIGYLARQESNRAPTAETEHHDVIVICSLSAVFFSWSLLTLLAALACLFVLQETALTSFLKRGGGGGVHELLQTFCSKHNEFCSLKTEN